MSSLPGMDDIVVALEQNNRVCQVQFFPIANWQLEKVLGVMQVPFLELIDLQLMSYDPTPPVIPNSFLGGSAPCLQFLHLDVIPFPGLPKLLLSTTHLVTLNLNIPHSNYISPETMAALLSVLSSLEGLILQFLPPQSRPDLESRRPRPPKRSVIPALRHFHFKWVIEYLEDLVTFIDAPQLHDLDIDLFNQVDFDGPRLAQFISPTPTFVAHDEAHVIFGGPVVSIELKYRASDRSGRLMINAPCRGPARQVSSVAQICNSCLPFLSRIEDLYIQEHPNSQRVWEHDAVDNTLWLEFLLPFLSVKNLYLSEDFASGIATVLREIVGTEVLPSLQKILVEELEPSGPFKIFQENVRQFIAARELSGHSITISVWNRPWYERKRRRWPEV